MYGYSWFIAAWPLAAFIILFICKQSAHRSVGLPLAYFIGMVLIHFVGASLYLLPNYQYYIPQIIFSGVRETTIGLYAFCAGLAVVKFFLDVNRVSDSRKLKKRINRAAPLNYYSNYRLPFFYAAFGLIAYLVGMPLIGRLPTVTALISGCTQAAVVGVCLGIFIAIQRRNKKHFQTWLATALLFPLLTLLNAGFVGFGVFSLISIATFALFFIRIKYTTVIAGCLSIFIGLSFYVTYMRDRGEIREIMWYQKNTLSDRISVVYDMFRRFEVFDVNNRKHLNLIDIRLNQNHLVGSAVQYLKGKQVSYALGKTIVDAFIALVPRIIWSDKPQVAGGSELVSQYTGMRFARGTSVGAGQVLEFYINFGRTGVVVGFLILGFLIGLVDNKASEKLFKHDLRGFVLWYLPGLGFLQSGGNIIEIVTTVAASMGSAIITTQLAEKYYKKNINLKRASDTSVQQRLIK